MLTSTLGPLSRLSRGLPASGRSYSSASVSSNESNLQFSTAPFRYSDALRIKKERFGQILEQFKTEYEAPIVKLHAEIRVKKRKEAKALQNRESRRAANMRSKERNAKKAESVRMETREFKLQDQLKDLLLEGDLSLGQFMASGDPRVQEMVAKGDFLEDYRLNFDAFDAEAMYADKWWSTGNLNTTFVPERLKLTPGERWHWEKHLPDEEWTKLISSELLACGLPLREDLQPASNTLEPLNDVDFEAQSERLSPETASEGIMKPLEPKWMPVSVSSPAVLSHEEVALKRFKNKSQHVDWSEPKTAFVLETDDFPVLSALIRKKSKLPAAFIQRKAKLRIHLPTLALPSVVRQRLVELVGTRYNEEKGYVVLVSDNQATRDENIAEVYKTAGKLLSEAWKADLNYVALEDPYPPHEQIQREIQLEAERAEALAAMDPKTFVKPHHYTFFSVASFPPKESVERGRSSVSEIVQEILGSSSQ